MSETTVPTVAPQVLENLGTNIEAACVRAGITVEELARRTEIAATSLRRWIANPQQFPMAAFIGIARACGISVTELFFGTDTIEATK